MEEIFDCFYWKENKELKGKIDYKYVKIGRNIVLKKPVLDTSSIKIITRDLKKNQAYLNDLDFFELLEITDQITSLWEDPNYKLRKLAEKLLPVITGFSEEMIKKFTFRFFTFLREGGVELLTKIDPEKFREFQEFGEGFLKAYGENNILYFNDKPKIVGHVCAGNIPGIACFEMMIDKIIGASTWIKTSSEEPITAVLYVKSIEEIDKKLAETIAILPFKSDDKKILEFLFSESDIVRATGGEKARKNLINISNKYKTPLAGHWHKLSFIVISREYLNRRVNQIAELAALDIIAWDQQGCFSPQEIFVEKGGIISPKEFTKILSDKIEKISKIIPKGSNSGNINVLDMFHRYSKKKIFGEPIEIYTSKNEDWLVVYDESNQNFEPSNLFRTIRVKPINNITDVVSKIKPISSFLQTIGVAIPQRRLLKFADIVGDVGVTNIRSVGGMTMPKAWETWDGKLPIGEIIKQDTIRWLSICSKNIDEEINELIELKNKILRN